MTRSTQAPTKEFTRRDHRRWYRVKTPTVIQMEAVECGAAALKIVLDYYGRIVPLEELRLACGVSRDGSRASNVVRAARRYGLNAKGYNKEPEKLHSMVMPLIVFWNFNHFVVVEGFGRNKVYINDPASGRRVISADEFDLAFTGVVLALEKGAEFQTGGRHPNLLLSLRNRLVGSEDAVLFVALVGLFLVIPGLVIPTLARVFIDYILIGRNDWLTPLLLFMGFMLLLRGGLTWIQQYSLLRLETKLAIGTSSKFLWHVLSLPIEFFTQRQPGEISSRVELANSVAKVLSERLALAILNLALMVFYGLLMFMYDSTLTLISLVLVSINFATLLYTARVRIDTNQQLLQEHGKLVGITYSGVAAIETIKATGSEGDFFSQWAGYHAKTANASQRFGLTSAFINAAPNLLTTLNQLAVLSVGAFRVMDGAMTLGMLVAFQSLLSSFLSPVNEFVGYGSLLQHIQGNVNRLDDVMQYPRDVQVGEFTGISPLPANLPVRLSGEVELKNVSFGYSKLAPPLIDDLNLTIKPGQRVAMVGRSGSGKSTVGKLIAGLYKPWSGEILLDGVPRRTIPRSIVCNSLALVDQDIQLFAGTMRDNLSLWDASSSDQDILQAAMDADIHDLIVQRGGYDAELEEAGRNLSGGQRQRLEIARALATNPSILVLDEAMSSLDPITEKIIDTNLRRRGSTCLIVAHRLSTIRDCDEIIVLDRGKVVQRGTHDSMIHTDGPYASLIKSEEYEAESKSMMESILDRL